MLDYPEWKKAACEWCAEGLPISSIQSWLHKIDKNHRLYSTTVATVLWCTAPTEAEHIEQLTARVAELEKERDVLDAEFNDWVDCVNDQIKPALGKAGMLDLREYRSGEPFWDMAARIHVGLQAENARLRTVLEEAHKIADSNMGTGHGLVKIRALCRVALSPEAVAAEPKADPIRKALEELIAHIEAIVPNYIADERSIYRQWDGTKIALASAREALKGAK